MNHPINSAMTAQYEAEKEKYRKYFSCDADQGGNSAAMEFQSTPLVALNVKYFKALSTHDSERQTSNPNANDKTVVDALPQYALLGLHVGDHSQICQGEPVMLNTATPNSTFICGSQGSGKSYTLACMLENYLLPDSDYGPVANPAAGVAFHYDNEGSGSVAEVASLCSRGIKVRVLVSRSNYVNRVGQYMSLAGAGENMKVQKLGFMDEHLDVERMKRLMAFSETAEGGVPLYVSVINRILREMNEEGTKFTFQKFEKKLSVQEQSFAANQKSMLNLRMDILRSFMHKPQLDRKGKIIKEDNLFKTEPGSLTIVDLTDPFVDQTTACVLFDICLGLFTENASKDGMAVVLDEAHRYMNAAAAAVTFTESLLTTIKMQRHTGTRIIIATQEPTISPRLMDLCSITIVHRFSSPAWFAAIKDHLAAASEAGRQEMFEEIVKLNAGESLVFSPSSFLCLDHQGKGKLGTGVMKMKTRGRKGIDSGKSKMAGTQDKDDPNGVLSLAMDRLGIWK